MTALRVVAVAVAMLLATWTVGWWAVVVVALVAGALWRGRRHDAGYVALSAVLAWSALLLLNARGGQLGRLMAVLDGVFPMPGAGLMALTLAFAAAGAWAAAVVGEAAGRRLVPGRSP